VLSLQDSVFLRRRPQGDIWQGLFEFPLVETSQMADLAGLMQHPEVSGWFDSQPWRVQGQPVCYRHRLTHQLLHVWFYEVKLTRMPRLPDEYIMVSRFFAAMQSPFVDKYLTEL
jgi:A/G-specific adenine glycosylase